MNQCQVSQISPMPWTLLLFPQYHVVGQTKQTHRKHESCIHIFAAYPIAGKNYKGFLFFLEIWIVIYKHIVYVAPGAGRDITNSGEFGGIFGASWFGWSGQYEAMFCQIFAAAEAGRPHMGDGIRWLPTACE